MTTEPTPQPANGPAQPTANGEPAAEPTPAAAALFDRAVDLLAELTEIMEALRLRAESQ